MNEAHLSAPEINHILVRHGYRLTGPRQAVIAAILERPQCFTAEQVVSDVHRRSPDLGRATVYRTLEILASVDILTRVFQPDGQPAYVVGLPGHRHHLVCSDCGTAVAFTTCPVDALVQDLSARTDFSINGHLLQVYGICPSCRPAGARVSNGHS
jgi:Fur family ferric uptake transcriptional regulator